MITRVLSVVDAVDGCSPMMLRNEVADAILLIVRLLVE